MRSAPIANGETIYAGNLNAIRGDAQGSASLSVHQLLGTFDLSTNPTNGKTLTLTINGSAVVTNFVTVLGTTANNILIGSTAADTVKSLWAFLVNPSVTNSTQVAASPADQTLLSYLWYNYVGTTLALGSMNNAQSAALTSFSASTNATGDTWASNTMALWVEGGVLYVNGTQVKYSGGITPTVTAPVTNPRIDVLTVDSSGTLAWTAGAENASPSAPAYPANKVPLCELYNVVGETALYDNANQQSSQGYVLNDVRPMLGTSFSPTAIASDMLPDADGTRNLGSGSFEWNNLYIKGGVYVSGNPLNSVMSQTFTAGENINAGDPVFISSGSASASAIAFDAGASSSTGAGTSLTFAHTCSGNNRVLFVGVRTSGTITGVTYNGVALTQINSIAITGGTNLYLWYLVNPASGANNVVVSASGSTDIEACSASYTGSKQVAVYDAKNTATANGVTTLGGSVTTVADNCWVVGFGGDNGAGITGAGASTTKRVTGGNSFNFYDSNGVVTPAGSRTLTITDTASGNLGLCLASFAPYGASSATVVYRANASQTATCNPFIGFAPSAISVGASGSVTLGGVATGLSGLTVGSQYYLANSPGVATAAGTVSKKVGIALSATSLLITNMV